MNKDVKTQIGATRSSYLQKSYLLYVSFTYHTWTALMNPFLDFHFKILE